MANLASEAIHHIQNHLGIHHYKSYFSLLPFLEHAFSSEGNEEIKNCPNCQNFFGIALMEGSGVDCDPERGLKLIEMAADQGYAKALQNLAYDYEHGEGVEMDLKKALDYCKAAVAQGDPVAKRSLSRITRKYETFLSVNNVEDHLREE